MMCWRVGSCWFIGDLRLATHVVAVLSLLGNVGVLAFTSWNIKLASLNLQHFLDSGDSTEKDLILVRSVRVGLAILAVTLLLSIVAVLLDVVLFFGAFRRRRDIVQCWLFGHAVVSGAFLVYFWFVIVEHFAAGHILDGLMYLSAFVIGAVLTVYFWVVVRSYDLKLQRPSVITVSGVCGPSRATSYVPASSQLGVPRDNDKQLHSPPPYNSNP